MMFGINRKVCQSLKSLCFRMWGTAAAACWKADLQPCKHCHVTALTAWQTAFPLSSSPTIRWCDCHPGPPRPTVCHPLRREKQNHSVKLWQTQLWLWFSAVWPLLATWKEPSRFDLRQVIHRPWHRDHCAASVWSQLKEARWIALPWCCQTAETKRQQKTRVKVWT